MILAPGKKCRVKDDLVNKLIALNNGQLLYCVFVDNLVVPNVVFFSRKMESEPWTFFFNKNWLRLGFAFEEQSHVS